MKAKYNIAFLLFLGLSFFLTIQESQAQYGQGGYGGGGYGGGAYGGGGYGRNRMADAGANMPRKQEEMDPEKMAASDTKWMTKKLSLTEEQIPKIENSNINYAFKRLDFQEEVKKLTPPFSEEVRSKMRAKILSIREDRDKELKTILTEEQFQIYLKKKDSY
ncbi:MAG: hypothetical protein V4585_12910 [Bacteroidota bacterium]|jgi:DNA-directed RNA polymerase subunit F